MQPPPVLSIKRSDFVTMLSFARTMHRLMCSLAYVRALADRLPEAARHDPGNVSVLMGYDFHLTQDGPRLIEINNNAGGLYVGEERWLGQPHISELPGCLRDRLVSMFDDAWHAIAVMDEHVHEQFMYPEMQAYADLLEQSGRAARVVYPDQLDVDVNGRLLMDGVMVDAIYNRHTDFYLETEELASIRRAYLDGRVALTPNPRSYALLGDKSRMVDWHRPGILDAILPGGDTDLIRTVVPEIHRMNEIEPERAWAERRQWVFKPAARHGGKGVLLGKAMGKRRFSEFDAASTVMQRYVPAPEVDVGGQTFKFDVRLYMHKEDLIAVAGRIWQGQVTNFRSPGSGFVSLDITDN